MAPDTTSQNHRARLFAAENPPEMVFEIRIATGMDAQRLRLAQARVLREVIAWAAAQKPSEPGQDRAA